MRPITIVERLHPFSHTPGTFFPVLGTLFSVQIFPAKLIFSSLDQKVELDLDIEGPVSGFTAILDLEKGRIRVFGKSASGFFSYFISDRGIFEEKKAASKSLFAKEFSLPFSPSLKTPCKQRLFLRSEKKLDWDLLYRRADLSEILPVWLRVASFLPEIKKAAPDALSLLSAKDRRVIAENFLTFFKLAFKGVFVPQEKDSCHLGKIGEIDSSCLAKKEEVFSLLLESAKQARALFFDEKEGALQILPQLPVEFVFGKMTAIQTEAGHLLDMEWTKKLIRRLRVKVASDCTLSIQFQKQIKSFRLKRGMKRSGERLNAGALISVKKGEILHLDQFEE